MKKIFAVALVALVAACAEDKEKPIAYGAPQAPTYTEQGAATTAQTTLEGSLAFQASTEPTFGAPGLGDQLAVNLGAIPVAAKMPTPASAKLAQGALRQAFETGGMDPACVGTVVDAAGVTTVTWTSCHIELSSVDPYTMDMAADIDGWLRWTPATGQTSWSIGETIALTVISEGETITTHTVAGLGGTVTVTASTIVADTRSTIDITMRYGGLTFNEALETTLAANLGYQAEPFCVTSGTFGLERRWLERPMGATEQSLPNQGWRFEWTGCNQFTVAHGS